MQASLVSNLKNFLLSLMIDLYLYSTHITIANGDYNVVSK